MSVHLLNYLWLATTQTLGNFTTILTIKYKVQCLMNLHFVMFTRYQFASSTVRSYAHAHVHTRIKARIKFNLRNKKTCLTHRSLSFAWDSSLQSTVLFHFQQIFNMKSSLLFTIQNLYACLLQFNSIRLFVHFIAIKLICNFCYYFNSIKSKILTTLNCFSAQPKIRLDFIYAVKVHGR